MKKVLICSVLCCFLLCVPVFAAAGPVDEPLISCSLCGQNSSSLGCNRLDVEGNVIKYCCPDCYDLYFCSECRCLVLDGQTHSDGCSLAPVPEPEPTPGPDVSSIPALVSSLGDIFTVALSWVAQVGSFILASPILLMFTVLPLVGFAIGLFKRLLNL